jgi:hypothetical protein
MANKKTEELLVGYTNKLDVQKLSLELESIKIRYRGEGITLENVSSLILILMEEVGKYKKLSGSDKKRLVIKIIENFIEDICPGKDTDIEKVLKQMVPSLIDGIIHVGKLKLFKKKLCKCF